MMGHLAAGQQLWVWLCRSCGKSRGSLEASIWCLGGPAVQAQLSLVPHRATTVWLLQASN